MNVSLTWPEYIAGCCRIEGRLRRLSYLDTDVLLALLLADPAHMTQIKDLIETTWPDPDVQPLGADGCVRSSVKRLRRHGVIIEMKRWQGYRIPAWARGRPERIQLAA